MVKPGRTWPFLKVKGWLQTKSRGCTRPTSPGARWRGVGPEGCGSSASVMPAAGNQKAAAEARAGRAYDARPAPGSALGRGGADLVRHLLVGEDLLDVVVLLERVGQLEQGAGGIDVGDRHGAVRNVGDFRGVGLDPLLVQGVGDPVEGVDVAAHLEAVVGGDDVVGPGLQRDLHQGVL